MDAVVLGGGGLTGRCAVRDLVRGGLFETVRVGDLDLALATSASIAAGGTGAVASRIDVKDPAGLAEILRGAAVCVNAVQYNYNLEVMAGCLQASVPYLDFGGLFHMTRRQLEWDAKFREAGLLAIPGLGQVPGVSNVLTAAGSADLDTVESVVIRDGWRDLTPNGPEIYFAWSPSTFLDEMQMKAVIWQGGAFHEVPPMSEAEEYEFAEPVGRTRIYRVLHSEAATLAESLRDKHIEHCEWKEGGPGIDLLRTMALLGLGSDRPVELRGTSVVPREFLMALLKRERLLGAPEGVVIRDWEITDVEIRGSRRGSPVVRHALARFPPRPDWGFTATEYAVGVCGAIGAELIARGEVRGSGVVPPERCVPPQRFRDELKARRIETTILPDEPPLGAVPNW